MAVGERFKNWIEGLSDSWKDKLRGWLLRSIAEGANRFLELNEPEAVELMQSQLNAIRDDKDTPQVLKDFIGGITAGTKPIPVFILIILGAFMLVPTITSIFRPMGNLWEYKQENILHTARFDPISAITAWRRDPVKYANVFGDLKDLGWNDDRIEALKFITQVIPNAADIVRFALREVYSPEIAEQYGQFQDIPAGAYPDAAKAGLPTDMFDKYWAAHWGLPSASDGFELLHRGILTEDQLKGLLKANDIMPYWRDQLIKLSWNIPTRVDVRRFWDMRTIDEVRLREIYTGLGYHGRDLEDYVLWTKIFVDFPDLLARYKNGWITLDQVKSELIAMGMKPERADTLIEEKIKKAAPERVAKERELTAAEIIKGVKKEVISWDDGLELLMDMGYDRDEAEFKLAIELAAAAGSPETFAEFKDLTQKWRLATGMEGKPVTEEIKKAGAEVIRLAGEVESLQRSIQDEERKLISQEILPAEATARRTELQASLHRAESELARVKTDYNIKVAEWRHGVK